MKKKKYEALLASYQGPTVSPSMPLSPLWPPRSCRASAEQAAGLGSIPRSVRGHRAPHPPCPFPEPPSGSGHRVQSSCTGLRGRAQPTPHPTLRAPSLLSLLAGCTAPRGPNPPPTCPRPTTLGRTGGSCQSSQATRAEPSPH